MSNNNSNKAKDKISKQRKKSFFKYLIESINWIQIAASPILFFSLLAVLFYTYIPNNTGLIISIIIAGGGLIVGIIWATRVIKKSGTTNYISKISGSPDFDKIDKE